MKDGTGEFRFRRDATRKAKKPRESREAVNADLSQADADLLAALKELRLEFARQRGVPVYVIFRDRTLIELAREKPADEAEFAQIFGVGEAKVRDFAEPFLARIAEYG